MRYKDRMVKVDCFCMGRACMWSYLLGQSTTDSGNVIGPNAYQVQKLSTLGRN
ncbi:MAG TPA: hypothetical protein VGK91_09360 [Candidatus Udaeobacter sp.]